jgi:hypothetical protein
MPTRDSVILPTTLPSGDAGKAILAWYQSLDAANKYIQATVPTDTSGTPIWPSQVALGDALANPTTALVGSCGLIWDSTNATWERALAIPEAEGTSGEGIPAAAIMGFDGTNYRRVGAVVGDSGQNGQVVVPARKEVPFTTTTAQAVGSTDCSNYRWVSMHVTSQGTSSVITFQTSNDNTNWTNALLNSTASITGGVAASTSSGGAIYAGPINARYFRLNVTGISAGTTAGTIEFFGSPNFPSSVPLGVAIVSLADGTTSTMGHVAGQLYNGTNWDRARTPNTFKTATATASGNTALWTPTSGKKFRLMGYAIYVPGDVATTGGGEIDVTFQDSSTGLGFGFTFFAPAASTSTAGATHSGFVVLGNGILSSAANNVLNVNLSAALSSGKIRVTVLGTEE